MGGACGLLGEGAGEVVVRREGKKLLGRPKRKWEYNIKINL